MHNATSGSPGSYQELHYWVKYLRREGLKEGLDGFRAYQEAYLEPSVATNKNLKIALRDVSSALVELISLKDKSVFEKPAETAINTFIASYNNFIRVSKGFWVCTEQARPRQLLLEDAAFLRIQWGSAEGGNRSAGGEIIWESSENRKQKSGIELLTKTLGNNLARVKADKPGEPAEKSMFYARSFLSFDNANRHSGDRVAKKTNIYINKKDRSIKKEKNIVCISSEEARYRSQFNALDALVTRLGSMTTRLMQYLTIGSKILHLHE